MPSRWARAARLDRDASLLFTLHKPSRDSHAKACASGPLPFTDICKEDSIIEAHRHRWSQVCFIWLGSGRQIFSDSGIPVEPGTLMVVPPGMMHAFKRTTNRRPLCLMIDFEKENASTQPKSGVLHTSLRSYADPAAADLHS